MRWEDLTIREKSDFMKTVLPYMKALGITPSFSEVRRVYNDAHQNRFDGGGYLEWKNTISKYKNLDIDNDSTYNYEAFYNEDPERAWGMLTLDPNAHFTDKFKTAYHPTFSVESMYSGQRSQYNPTGRKGGHWGGKDGETFIPEPPFKMYDRGGTLLDKKKVYNRLPADATQYISDPLGLMTALYAGIKYLAEDDNKVDKFISNIKKNLSELDNGTFINPSGGQFTDEQLREQYNNLLGLEDAKDVYLGMPQRSNTLVPATEKPSMGTLNNAYKSTYLSSDPHVMETYLLPAYYNLLKKNIDKETLPGNIYEIGKSGNNANTVLPIVGHATIGSGVDPQRGSYLSYYDTWDVNLRGKKNGKDRVASLMGGKPFDLYDRIYLDDYYGINSAPSQGDYWGGYLPELVVTTPNKYYRGGRLFAPGGNTKDASPLLFIDPYTGNLDFYATGRVAQPDGTVLSRQRVAAPTAHNPNGYYYSATEKVPQYYMGQLPEVTVTPGRTDTPTSYGFGRRARLQSGPELIRGLGNFAGTLADLTDVVNEPNKYGELASTAAFFVPGYFQTWLTNLVAGDLYNKFSTASYKPEQYNTANTIMAIAFPKIANAGALALNLATSKYARQKAAESISNTITNLYRGVETNPHSEFLRALWSTYNPITKLWFVKQNPVSFDSLMLNTMKKYPHGALLILNDPYQLTNVDDYWPIESSGVDVTAKVFQSPLIPMGSRNAVLRVHPFGTFNPTMANNMSFNLRALEDEGFNAKDALGFYAEHNKGVRNIPKILDDEWEVYYNNLKREFSETFVHPYTRPISGLPQNSEEWMTESSFPNSSSEVAKESIIRALSLGPSARHLARSFYGSLIDEVQKHGTTASSSSWEPLSYEDIQRLYPKSYTISTRKLSDVGLTSKDIQGLMKDRAAHQDVEKKLHSIGIDLPPNSHLLIHLDTGEVPALVETADGRLMVDWKLLEEGQKGRLIGVWHQFWGKGAEGEVPTLWFNSKTPYFAVDPKYKTLYMIPYSPEMRAQIDWNHSIGNGVGNTGYTIDKDIPLYLIDHDLAFIPLRGTQGEGVSSIATLNASPDLRLVQYKPTPLPTGTVVVRDINGAPHILKLGNPDPAEGFLTADYPKMKTESKVYVPKEELDNIKNYGYGYKTWDLMKAYEILADRNPTNYPFSATSPQLGLKEIFNIPGAHDYFEAADIFSEMEKKAENDMYNYYRERVIDEAVRKMRKSGFDVEFIPKEEYDAMNEWLNTDHGNNVSASNYMGEAKTAAEKALSDKSTFVPYDKINSTLALQTGQNYLASMKAGKATNSHALEVERLFLPGEDGRLYNPLGNMGPWLNTPHGALFTDPQLGSLVTYSPSERFAGHFTSTIPADSPFAVRGISHIAPNPAEGIFNPNIIGLMNKAGASGAPMFMAIPERNANILLKRTNGWIPLGQTAQPWQGSVVTKTVLGNAALVKNPITRRELMKNITDPDAHGILDWMEKSGESIFKKYGGRIKKK